MTERVKIRQNSNFEIGFWVMDTEDPERDEFEQVIHIHELSPYGMLLASLGSCTTIVLHTYAQNHGIPLDEVETVLDYERNFLEDCENCETIEQYEEHIQEQISFFGNLGEKDLRKLSQVADYCSIHKMLEAGIEIRSEKSFAEEVPEE